MIHLHKEIEKIKKQVLSLGAEVEQNVHRALKSIEQRDTQIEGKIIAADDEIDCHEVDLEEECLKIMALHQPVAGDLRFIIAIFKMNTDLERIGDLAVNISVRTQFMAQTEKISIPSEFFKMSEKATSMLRRSLDAMVNSDKKAAYDVCNDDDDVDKLYHRFRDDITNRIAADPKNNHTLVRVLEIGHHVERIADHATNIAEDVIYMLDGKIIRHGRQLNSDN